MKRITLCFICVLFAFTSFGQSLTFADMQYLAKQKTAKEFMLKKNFKLTEQKGGFESYDLRLSPTLWETVSFSPRGIDYSSLNKAYISSLVKQIQQEYKLIIKSDESEYIYYQFGNPSINITVNINKKTNVLSSVALIKKL